MLHHYTDKECYNKYRSENLSKCPHCTQRVQIPDIEEMKAMTKTKRPAVIDGRNIINPDAFLDNGWIYRGIGHGDKNNLS